MRPPVSRLVTALVLLGVAGLAGEGIYRVVRRDKVSGAFHTYALFRDASLITVGSPVRIAGVNVGEVDALTIEGNLAKVSMRLRDDLHLTERTWATKRADSPFAPSYVELIPAGEVDDATTPPRLLAPGEAIPRVTEGVTTDRVLRTIDHGIPKFERGLAAVQRFVADGQQNIVGEMRDRLAVADAWVTRAELSAKLAEVQRGAIELDQATDKADDKARISLADISHGLERFDHGITNARQEIAGAKASFADSMAETRANLDRLDPYLDDAAEMVGDLSGDDGRGRGTLGKLIYDDTLYDDVADAVQSADSLLATVNGIRTVIGARGEWNILSGTPRIYATAEVSFSADSYFLLETERGYDGTPPHGTLSSDGMRYVLRSEIEDKLRFTAQMGKRLGRWSFRAGIKDSTVGAAIESKWFDHLTLSADLFGGFTRDVPRLKVTASLRLFRQMYILAGVDDVLREGQDVPIAPWSPGHDVPRPLETGHFGRDVFIGGALTLPEEDLAGLLRVYGAILAALAL